VRIAVVGAGAVGGYFGGRLAEAGHDVGFVARGATLAALRTGGLRIDSIGGDLHLPRVDATDDPATIGAVDAVIVTVKAWQVREAAPSLRPLLGPDTCVLPLQNGVEAADELADALGAARVLGGLCKILSEAVAPAHIRHSGVEPRVEIGERDGRRTPRAQALAQALDGARAVTAVVVDDIEAALWEKFLFIASFGGVGAVCRQGAGDLRAVAETHALLRAAMQEITDLAAARGVRLPAGVVERNLQFVESLPPHAMASMARDIAAGRPSELEQQPGAVVRLAARAGVAAPVHGFLYAALLPSERRARAPRATA
jgi:2-dehydropantoate 2-reductase